MASWIRARQALIVLGVAAGVLLIAAAILILVAGRSPALQGRVVSAVAAWQTCRDCTNFERVRFAVHSGSKAPAPFIRGGSETLPGDYPGVGALLDSSRPICTATLITADTALTAAHCVFGRDAKTLRFKLGTNVIADDTAGTAISSFLIPDVSDRPLGPYDPGTLQNDIALVYLQDRVRARRHPVAESAQKSIASLKDQEITIVGYGFNDLFRGGRGIQRAAEFRVTRVSSTRLEYGDARKSVCYVDSGGPAFRRGEIVGITSSTTGCRGGRSTWATRYSEWIAANTQ